MNHVLISRLVDHLVNHVTCTVADFAREFACQRLFVSLPLPPLHLSHRLHWFECHFYFVLKLPSLHRVTVKLTYETT